MITKSILFLILVSLFFNIVYSKEPTFQKYYTENFSVFDNCFELYVTSGVLENWGDSDIASFINLVLDDDTSNTSDIFPSIWDYFTPDGLDSSQGGIRFIVQDSTYTKIKYYLYDPNDAQCGEKPSRFC